MEPYDEVPPSGSKTTPATGDRASTKTTTPRRLGLTPTQQGVMKIRLSGRQVAHELVMHELFLNEAQRHDLVHDLPAMVNSAKHQITAAIEAGASNVRLYVLPTRAGYLAPARQVVAYAAQAGYRWAYVPVTKKDTYASIAKRVGLYNKLAGGATRWFAAADLELVRGINAAKTLAAHPYGKRMVLVARGKKYLRRAQNDLALTLAEEGVQAIIVNAPYEIDDLASSALRGVVKGFHALSPRLRRGGGNPDEPVDPRPVHERAADMHLYNDATGAFPPVKRDRAWAAQATALRSQGAYEDFWARLEETNLATHYKAVAAYQATPNKAAWIAARPGLAATLP